MDGSNKSCLTIRPVLMQIQFHFRNGKRYVLHWPCSANTTSALIRIQARLVWPWINTVSATSDGWGRAYRNGPGPVARPILCAIERISRRLRRATHRLTRPTYPIWLSKVTAGRQGGGGPPSALRSLSTKTPRESYSIRATKLTPILFSKSTLFNLL